MKDPLNACKDAHPADTLRRIREILGSHGIETREQWNESGVPYCHSVRIGVAGTPFGTNGKGVSRELALASGYGELMERLQLGYLMKTGSQKAAPQADAAGPERVMDLQGLLGSGLFEQYAALAKKATGAELTAQAILSQYADARGHIPVTGYYSIRQGREVFLPTALARSVYTTNGCAAGNTLEEALVQAISEIVERNYKSRILTESIPLPDIGDETLRRCPIAWEIIRFLRERDFRVSVKDCSLGSKFPVVCVCLVDRRTGRYHTHFGAFPNFEIALQRTLTESFQGRSLEHIGQYENFTADAAAPAQLMKELVSGTGEKPQEFFLPAGESHPGSGFGSRDNRALLKECLEFFKDQGLDVWVRDCSCLGFPTCQVIIPGYSEIFPHRLSPRHSDTRYAPVARRVLRSPATARPDEWMGLLMHLGQSKAAGLGVGSFLAQANLAAEVSAREDGFLMNATLAYVQYGLGKTSEALKAIHNAMALASGEDGEYLLCLARYLELTGKGTEAAQVRRLLEYFHREETVTRLYGLLESRKNPLEPLVLRCGHTCAPDCPLTATCRKAATDKIAALVAERQSRLSQLPLQSLLQGL